MTFKEFRKKHQGKYYKAYVEYYMYIHIVKIRPFPNDPDNFSAFVNSIMYAEGDISYVENSEWVINEGDFGDNGKIYMEIPKKVYDEHMRRYKIECEWANQGINY